MSETVTIPRRWTVKKEGHSWVADSHTGWRSYCQTWQEAFAVAFERSSQRRSGFWKSMQARGKA